jgi:hypothetical protein
MINLEQLKIDREKERTLQNSKALFILGIFFVKWRSITEASKIYNPKLSKKWANDRMVNYYFKKFESYGWIEHKKFIGSCERNSKFGKKQVLKYPLTRYRINYEPYLLRYSMLQSDETNKNIKNKLKPFLDNNREKIIKEFIKENAFSTELSIEISFISLFYVICFEIEKFLKTY